MTPLMKLIIGIVVLLAIAFVIRSFTGSNESDFAAEEEAWGKAFAPILSDINRAGIEPAQAMLDVQLCETISDCDLALQNMSDSLKPNRSSLLFALQELPVKIPPKFQRFEQNYQMMLELRFEASDFYIRGIDDGDDELLARGDELWSEALIASSNYLDQLESILE